MKKTLILLFILSLTTLYSLDAAGLWADPIPVPKSISAEQAFDAFQRQMDPFSYANRKVALVDVRTRAEYFWVGSACKVDEIITTWGEGIVPDAGKVILKQNGKMIRFRLNGRKKRINVMRISRIVLSPIAINIPYKLWVEESATLMPNPDFKKTVEDLYHEHGYEVIIFFCRSGVRSNICLKDFDTSLFKAIYDIDHPDGENARGGFEGASYDNAYNGYRGFPQRKTALQLFPSVSWKDAGLPIRTSLRPDIQ